MKILLVDDEKKFVMMLAKRLALRGIEVDYVYTAEEAVAKVESNLYDVAILDVKMPGIGGIELERKLKALVPGDEKYLSDRPWVRGRLYSRIGGGCLLSRQTAPN